MEAKETLEENKKIRFLRFLVDFSLLEVEENDISYERALEVVEEVKRAACGLFPGKEETFELIYRPRFMRIIREKYGFPDSKSQITNPK
jgi:hypothetical protein